MGADVTVKGLLGLETGDGGGLGKKDGWLALRGETTITSLELAPARGITAPMSKIADGIPSPNRE